ncbi:MAG: FmdB family zinc ribbon protein [Phycisphaerales bacterium]
MPTYDYICTACKHEFEEFQAMSAKTLKKCPSCGKPKLERKIGIGAGILFKGGGFYETDYRSESYKKAAEAETKPAEAKPEVKADAKPDSKPESKPESKDAAKPDPKPDPKPAPKSTPTKLATKPNKKR